MRTSVQLTILMSILPPLACGQDSEARTPSADPRTADAQAGQPAAPAKQAAATAPTTKPTGRTDRTHVRISQRWHAHIQEQLESGMSGWVPSLRSPESQADAEALLARSREIENLAATSIDTEQRVSMPGRTALPPLTFDLRDPSQRIDAVLVCLANHGGSAEFCDLATVLSPQEALAKNSAAQAKADSTPYLGSSFQWHDLLESCPDPEETGRCMAALSLDARDGTCIVGRKCKYGRPFEGGRTASWIGFEGPPAAAAWVRIAQLEHASAAAFARHARELIAINAPHELVQGALEARQDELRHTELAIEQVAAFGGVGRLGADLTPLEAPRDGLFAVMLGVATEGCIAETLSAIECAIALEEVDAIDSADLHARLAQITDDEAKHAAHAWRTLAWGLPQLSQMERQQILQALCDPPCEAAAPQPEGIGVLGGFSAQKARRWGVQHVIEPMLRALFRTRQSTTPTPCAHA
ncbi:MAG TPA: hypothetical protein ENJ18_12345 [Nannocystis exedens]|nr:hypothetical protein [Nannocystis exedens]